MFTDQYDWTRCKSPKMFLFRHMVKKLTKWSQPTKRRQKGHYNTNYTGTYIWYCTQWFASINSSAIRFMGLFAKFRQEETALCRKFSHPTSELRQQCCKYYEGQQSNKLLAFCLYCQFYIILFENSQFISDHTKSTRKQHTIYSVSRFTKICLIFYSFCDFILARRSVRTLGEEKQ